MGELSLERAHQKMKTALMKTNGKEEHIQVMNAVRFNDWLGRLTSVLKPNGNAISLHVAECGRLLHGRNVLAQPGDQPFMQKLSTFFDPVGLIYQTILHDKATVFGKHGTFCTRASDFHFSPSFDTRHISSLDLFDFDAHGSEICAKVGLNHHPTCNPNFLLKVTKHCMCRQRGIVVSAGDVRVRHTCINDEVVVEYHRILFFVRQSDPAASLSMVLEDWVRAEHEHTPECVTVIKRSPEPIYHMEPLTVSTIIHPLLHNCGGSTCQLRGNNEIEHSANATNVMEFIVLDASMGFPPRKG